MCPVYLGKACFGEFEWKRRGVILSTGDFHWNYFLRTMRAAATSATTKASANRGQ